ncbi:entericidin A/B family lipoprotein [Novosphingobium sp. 9U]|nr:entericidin A/B family lipoprotein [Novosphingobium sp. 9U]
MGRHIITFALITGCLALTACNTVQGFGKDLEVAGGALEKVD